MEDLRLLVNGGAEHGVQIHPGQIEKILVVPTAYRIDRLVRIGHGVQKRVEGAFQKLHKRLLHRVFLRPAEHRVL